MNKIKEIKKLVNCGLIIVLSLFIGCEDDIIIASEEENFDGIELPSTNKQIIESIANSIEGRSNLNGENEDADDEDDLEKLASKKQRGY